MLGAGLAAVKGRLRQARRATAGGDAQEGDGGQPARQVHALGGRSANPVQDMYLRGAKGENNDPGTARWRSKALADPARRLPNSDRLGVDLATFLVQCLNAVQYGLLLFLVASGLTLIFGSWA